jgi:hypothetical protein
MVRRRKVRRIEVGDSRAERNIKWCEKYLKVPEGQFVGRKLKLAEFMRDDFRAIYDNPAGTRHRDHFAWAPRTPRPPSAP